MNQAHRNGKLEIETLDMAAPQCHLYNNLCMKFTSSYYSQHQIVIFFLLVLGMSKFTQLDTGGNS